MWMGGTSLKNNLILGKKLKKLKRLIYDKVGIWLFGNYLVLLMKIICTKKYIEI